MYTVLAMNYTICIMFYRSVIKEGIEVPEGSNDLRRTQLRELALLNGTLR